MKNLAIATIFLIGFLFSAGCLGDSSETAEDTAASELSGTIKLGGSTTVYPIATKAGEVFMQRHPGVTITVDQSSSGEGLARFLKGEIDISDATRPPKDIEYDEAESKGINLQMTVISNDAVVVVVHKSSPLRDISSEELKKIFFTGEISDWSEITDGKKTGKINVYGTDPFLSGTAELFIGKISKGGEFVEGYEILHPTPTVVTTIAGEPNGIAYTPLKWVDDSVVLLSVDGVTPSEVSILDTSYKLSRKMLMITDGIPSGLEREYINFILSSEGQKIVEDEGFVPIS